MASMCLLKTDVLLMSTYGITNSFSQVQMSIICPGKRCKESTLKKYLVLILRFNITVLVKNIITRKRRCEIIIMFIFSLIRQGSAAFWSNYIMIAYMNNPS